MKEELHEEFDNSKTDAVDYYEGKLRRDQVDFLATITNTETDGSTIREDVKTLYDKGELKDFHKFIAKLERIGSNTLLEGISLIEEERLKELNTDQKESTTWIKLHLLKWGWEDELDLFTTLKQFSGRSTYSRKKVDGEPAYQKPSKHEKEIEKEIQKKIHQKNELRKYKANLRRIDFVGKDRIFVRFDVERRAGRYRQFNFREEDGDEDGEDFDTHSEEYHPIKTRYFFLDYEGHEYDYSMTRRPVDFEEAILEVFYQDYDENGDVEFVLPTDFPEMTPEKFIEQRVLNEVKEYTNDSNLSKSEKEARKNVLSNIETAEQTAITLQNVPGEFDELTIKATKPLMELIRERNLEDEYEDWAEKSKNAQYDLDLKDKTVEVSRTQITIHGNTTQAEEDVITSILRKSDGADEEGNS